MCERPLAFIKWQTDRWWQMREKDARDWMSGGLIPHTHSASEGPRRHAKSKGRGRELNESSYLSERRVLALRTTIKSPNRTARADEVAVMAQKTSKDEHGVRTKQRSKSDKARRTFELHGSYSHRHIRQLEALKEKHCHGGGGATVMAAAAGRPKEKKKGG